MRTRDIVRKLKNSDLLLATAKVEGNAIYTRNCKIKIPYKEKMLSWMSRTLLGKDYLKAYINEDIELGPESLDMLLQTIHETGSVTDAFIQLHQDYYEPSDMSVDGDFRLQCVWLELHLDSDDSHELSHYLDRSDLHTFHKKDEREYEERFQYRDNWVEADGKLIELGNLKNFTKYISGGMSMDGAVSYDSFMLESLCDDRDRKIQLTLWEYGPNKELDPIPEKQLIRVAHEYCEGREWV